jgi:hypothetical protein
MTTSIVVTESSELTQTKAPALPFAPVEYDRQYQDTFNNILRQYFNTLDNFVSLLTLSSGGTGAGVFLPNGAFQDSTTQTAANTTTAYPITFNTTDYSNGVALESGSRLKVTYAGRYNLQFSVQLENTTNAPVDIDIWVRKNGTNIASSNSRFGLPARKNPGDPFHVIASLNLLIDLQATQYVELVWCTGDVGADIKAYAAGTSPTRPAIPSVIATMTFVSAI